MATLFTDPLAANLVIVGILLFGLAFYATIKYVFRRELEGFDKSFGYFLLVIGGYLTIYGLFYSLLWPTPMSGAYNILFGDSMTVLGFVTVLGGFTLTRGLSLAFVAIFAFFAGLYALFSGFGGYADAMTQSPIGMLGMYMGAGFAGLLIPVVYFTRAFGTMSGTGIKNVAAHGKDLASHPSMWLTFSQIFAILFVISAVIGAAIAVYTGYSAIADHLSSFAKVSGL